MRIYLFIVIILKYEREVTIENKKRMSFENVINVIFQLSFFQIKTLIKIPMMMFIIFGLPIIVLLGLGILINEASLFVPVFSLCTILMVGLVYGYLYYSSSNTTFSNNSNLTRNNLRLVNVSIFFTTLMFALLSISVELIVFISFTSLGWVFSSTWAFLPDGIPLPSSLSIVWKELPWAQIIYYFLMTITLSFLFFSMFRTLFKSNQSFTMFVFTYFIFTLCFGHSITPTFDLLQSNGQLWSNSFNNGNKTIEYNKWYSFASLLTPQSFLNQTFFTIFYSGAIPAKLDIGKQLPSHFNYFKWSDDISYNYALIFPFLYLVGMWFFSSIIIKEKIN